MTNNPIKLNNQEIFSDFDNHISLEGNDRILFSAPFGTGKSTYLTEYFEHNYEDYFCFNLYPVNYSVSQNEDIFELIKFDLLLQLMGKHRDEIDLKDENFSNVLSFQALFLKEIKLAPILLSLMGESGKIGTSAKILIDEVQKQYKEFKETFENEEAFIEEYLRNIENKIGNINEMDAYSSMIYKLLERVKSKNEKKESVLIIDDLDRLDPEHIFRLFNIFSINFGKDKILNKFGFDKIIFVCDIENIKNIYKHKYGSNVDFVGYIDKFYSYIPYEFDNIEIINKKLEELIELNNNSESLFGTKDTREAERYQLFNSLKAVLISLLNNNLINLRMLFNVRSLIVKSNTFYYSDRSQRHTYEFSIITLFSILKNYFGSFKEVQITIRKMANITAQRKFSANHKLYNYNDEAFRSLLALCLPFLFELNGLGEIKNEQTEDGYVFHSANFDCYIHYKSNYDFRGSYDYYSIRNVTKNNDIKNDMMLLNPFEVLKYTFDECIKRGAITL